MAFLRIDFNPAFLIKFTFAFVLLILLFGCKSKHHLRYFDGHKSFLIKNKLTKKQPNFSLDESGNFAVANQKGSTQLSIYSLKKQEFLESIELPQQPITIQLSPQGNLLGIVLSKKILVYQLPSMQLLTSISTKNVENLKFSYDEHTLVFTTKKTFGKTNFTSFSLAEDRQLFSVKPKYSGFNLGIHINPESTRFATFYPDDYYEYIDVWDLYDGELLIEAGTFYKLLMSSDLETVLSYVNPPQLNLRRSDTSSNQQIEVLYGKAKGLNRLTFNNQNNQLAVAAKNAKVFVIDLPSETIVSELSAHQRGVNLVAFDQQDLNLLSASYAENKIILWNLLAHKKTHSIDTEMNRGTILNFSPCNDFIYCFNQNNQQLSLFNRQTGILTNNFQLKNEEDLYQIVETTDNVYLLSHKNQQEFFVRSIHSSDVITTLE